MNNIKLKSIINEDLRKWFGKGKTGSTTGGGWDRYNTKGEKVGKCGDADAGEPYVACLSKEKADKLGPDGRASFVKRKRAAQKKAGDAKKGGEQFKGQKPVMVKTKANEMQNSLEEKLNLFLEKNIPTDPEKWSYAKSQAKKKFDIYPCVPLNSLAITCDGLKSYDELILGENILTYNIQNDELEWKPIKNIHYYENADLMEIKKSTGFKFKCTPNHKWVIKRDESREAELIEAKDITTHMRIVFSSILKNQNIKFDILNENWSKHDLWTNRIVNMTPSEREVWLSNAIVYDGWDKGKSTKIDNIQTFGFSQKNRDHLLSTIYAAFLNGYYVSVNNFDNDVVSVTIIRNKQTHGTQNLIKTYLDETEDVWCPETENGTWVMMQNGWFTITGNSAYANGWAAKKYKELGGGWKKEK
jgi:hypothetical protein